MMMQWVLRIALVVSVILLTFSNRCSTNGIDLSLADEVFEGMGFMSDIQQAIPGTECEEHVDGLNHLRKQALCCTKCRKKGIKTNKCIGEDLLDICLYALDVASGYIDFFDSEFNESLDDAEIQNLRNKLQDYHMSYTNRLGQCIDPVENDRKTYEVRFPNDTECDRKNLILGGFKQWRKSVAKIYRDLNDTVNNETESQLDSRCHEEDKKRKRALKRERKQRKQEKKEKRKRQKEEKEERKRQREEKEERKRQRNEKKENRRRKERENQPVNQNEEIIISSTPDCI